MDRRKFLASNLGLCLVSMLGCSQKTVKADQLVFSGCTDTKNQHYAAAFTPEGECYFIQPIPERSHHSEYLPNQGQVLFFDRSPGTHFYVIDIDSKKLWDSERHTAFLNMVNLGFSIKEIMELGTWLSKNNFANEVA